MDQCKVCERLWKAYQIATIQSVQLYGEIRSMTEGQGLQKLSETTTKAEAAEQLRVEPAKGWQHISQQPGIGESSSSPLPASLAGRFIAIGKPQKV